MKRLTDAEIRCLENWAENKKKEYLSEQEKQMIEQIERYKKDNWKGLRITGTERSKTFEKLEELKRKKI